MKRPVIVLLSLLVGAITLTAEFLTTPGSYKAEVLAIEQSGNQTLTEVAFTVRWSINGLV